MARRTFTREELAAVRKIREVTHDREKKEATARREAERELKALVKEHGPEQVLRWARAGQGMAERAGTLREAAE